MKKPITINVNEKEKEQLVKYCKDQGRTITDVLREYIRTLETK